MNTLIFSNISEISKVKYKLFNHSFGILKTNVFGLIVRNYNIYHIAFNSVLVKCISVHFDLMQY